MVIFERVIPTLPLLFLCLSSIIVFLCARVMRFSNKGLAALSAFLFLLTIFSFIFDDWLQRLLVERINSFQIIEKLQPSAISFVQSDPGARIISILALSLALVVSIFSGEYLLLDRRQQLFYPLLFLMICGLLGMLFSTNLMILYLFCELMSISAYSLVGFRRDIDTAIEAGFKYLIMGSTASIVILTGILFLFLEKGHIDIEKMRLSSRWITQLGVLLFFAGFCLKSALVPLHTWLPDAHGRAPSSISAILSGIIVQGVLYVMIKNTLALGLDSAFLGQLLLILSIFNIVIGNLMGISQNYTKRLLGYSTIAQMGYITMCIAIGLITKTTPPIRAGFFIMFTHALAKALAFLSKGVFHYYTGASEIKHLSRASELPVFPSLSFGLAIFSLSAIPPFPGFTGKWLALSSFISQNKPISNISAFFLLAGSLLAFGYYFPLLINIFNYSPNPSADAKIIIIKKKVSLWITIPLGVLFFSIIFISFMPGRFLNLSDEAARYLMTFVR